MQSFFLQLHRLTSQWESEVGLYLPEAHVRFRVLVLSALTLLVTGGLAVALVLISLGVKKPLSPRKLRFVRIALVPWLLGAVAFLYGYFVEPHRLEITHTSISTARLSEGKRLRIVLISDVHAEKRSSVMAELPGLVGAEHPDLIIFTGDAINSSSGVAPFEELFSAMDAPSGRFGVYGNHDTYEALPTDLYSKSGLVELDHRPVRIGDGSVVLCGAPFDRPGDALACLDEAGPGFHIVVYHSPDIAPDAAKRGADLVLSGHTHGGQIRLPFYGALITMSGFDKRFESGLYHLGETALYVTRGIGEARQLPAVRLFCRPELSVIDIIGTGRSAPPPPHTLARNPETNLPYVVE